MAHRTEIRDEGRCECGRLLIKKTPKGFEIKCPRCKRYHLLEFEQNELFLRYDSDVCPVFHLVEEPVSKTSAARDRESNAQLKERR